jgi:hypothetical protein
MVVLLDRLPDWGLVLAFAATLAFTTYTLALDFSGGARSPPWDVLTPLFEGLGTILLYLELREMERREWL